jgi:PiT family inorganic phosphate transporter
MGVIAPLHDGADHHFTSRSGIIICSIAIALGTLTGGWRIVHARRPRHEAAPGGRLRAETAGAISLELHFGILVSTTHTITGATRRARRIV